MFKTLLKPIQFISNRLAKAAWSYFLRDQLLSELRRKELLSQVLRETCVGTTTNSILDGTEVIVSLTTHDYRIHEVCLAIESIMQGSIKPNRIILWLDENLPEEAIPQSLRRQQQRGLEIRRTHDQMAYTKLLPALHAFPDAIIVTIDDDIYYPYDTLEVLLQAHRNTPDAICANFIKKVQLKRKGQLLTFIKWPLATQATDPKSLYYFEGFGGVLYPPHCFSDEVFNSTIFTQHCPFADDVWFNVMAIHDHIPIRYADAHYESFPYVDNPQAQRIGLKLINDNPHDCRNDIQYRSVLEHYGLFTPLLDKLWEINH